MVGLNNFSWKLSGYNEHPGLPMGLVVAAAENMVVKRKNLSLTLHEKSGTARVARQMSNYWLKRRVCPVGPRHTDGVKGSYEVRWVPQT